MKNGLTFVSFVVVLDFVVDDVVIVVAVVVVVFIVGGVLPDVDAVVVNDESRAELVRVQMPNRPI